MNLVGVLTRARFFHFGAGETESESKGENERESETETVEFRWCSDTSAISGFLGGRERERERARDIERQRETETDRERERHTPDARMGWLRSVGSIKL